VAAKINTKREIEIKLRVSNLREVLRHIRKMGAVPSGRTFEQNTLFDTPDSSFWRHGRLLRLRTHPAMARAAARERRF
jgi:inorganic triphosphatase YgiF